MKFKNKLGFLSIFLFILIISSGIVFAEDSALPSVENGEVSGNVDIATVNPFSTKNTSAELEYKIPASASEIQSAYVVVSTYSGSGNYTYGLTTNISLRTANTTEVLEYANLTFVNDTANDPVVYPITDLTSKQYSDYQSLINITDKVKGLSSGDTVTISVNNTELEGYIFDGRIKLIALVFAYNDNDNDKISYWLNIGQAWTKGTLTTVFKTKDFDGEYEDVALESVSLSSTDANYTLNGIELSDPIQRKGSNFIYDKWDVTDIFEMGNDTSLACTNTGKYSYKAVIQLLTVYNPEVHYIAADIKTEYTSTPSVYAGVNNTLTVKVNNYNKNFNGSVKLYIGDEELDSVDVAINAYNSTSITLVDPTIRPVTANTVNGNNNEKVNYTVVIEDADGFVLNETDASIVLVYDGYLGKDFEYPGANPLEREFYITGDVIVLNTEDYSAAGATSRNDTYNVDLDGGVVNTALLYVSYNWDKIVGDDYNTWNTTFNGVAIAPIATYRDQSNLGGLYSKYGYGLVVYNVTELVVDGNNTFALEKISGNAAVYPSNLIILTDKDASAVESTVYIWEEADLLSKSYNKFVPAGFNSNFTVIDGNATLFVFAASAQAGEGNIIVNNETYENVWSGSSYSFDIFSTDVNGTDISVYFEATGSTILGLHQMVVVENPRIAMSTNMKSEYTSVPSVYAGVNNTFALTVNNDGADVENVTVYVLEGQNLVGNFTIDSMLLGDKEVFTVVDHTIWPITENTVNGNDNEIANYTVVIMDADGNIIDLANYSFVVVYDGYLGKDFEYPNALSLLWEITFTGDAIVLKTDAYSAGAATNRTDVYEVDLANGTVNRALLYVSYNWDKALDGDYKTWNTTFNGVAITPIEAFRDQSNLGGASAKYGYGLVVYDVSELVVDGNNTFAFEKIKGNSAVYPSNLIVLTDKNNSAYKTAYIIEEADLLSKSYNKYVPAGFETSFEIVEGNATLYVFAASAQAGEGNIIVNNETYENVWNGSSYSFDTFTVPVNGTDINIYFEAIGSTILGLHQMIIVEHENYLVIEAPDVTKYYKGPERFVVTVTDCLGTPVANKTVSITINGVTYNRTTDEKGTASMALGLNSGEYNVTAAVDNNTVDSIVTILPTVNGTDVVKVFRNATQYYATFLDSEGNYLKDGTTVNFNINGVMYERKVSGNYGMARLNINLEQGTYIITAINPVTGENAANNITVLPNIVNNTDLVKYYRNDSQYYVTIIGDDGNPVGANETVIFNINGVMYERTTNENGTARLNINLQPGDYIITAMYNGCNVANNITVLPVLSAQDVTMTYKDGTQFKANLVDGQGKPLADTNVTFNINGVFYNRATDANGVAALNINLMPGEYIITSSYNGTNIANTIKING